MPRYNGRTRKWGGGDRATLYAYTDTRTGQVFVRPCYALGAMAGPPDGQVRVATRAEAESGWQNPLHSGWKVVD